MKIEKNIRKRRPKNMSKKRVAKNIERLGIENAKATVEKEQEMKNLIYLK